MYRNRVNFFEHIDCVGVTLAFEICYQSEVFGSVIQVGSLVSSHFCLKCDFFFFFSILFSSFYYWIFLYLHMCVCVCACEKNTLMHGIAIPVSMGFGLCSPSHTRLQIRVPFQLTQSWKIYMILSWWSRQYRIPKRVGHFTFVARTSVTYNFG